MAISAKYRLSGFTAFWYNIPLGVARVRPEGGVMECEVTGTSAGELNPLLEPLDLLRGPSDLGWSPAGGAVFATVAPASYGKGEGYRSWIWQFPLEGEPTRVMDAAGPESDVRPQFSPEGRQFAFLSEQMDYRGSIGWGQPFARTNVGDPAAAKFQDILRGIDACVAAGERAHVADARRRKVACDPHLRPGA